MAATASPWPVVTDQVASQWLRRGIGRVQTSPSDPDGATAATVRMMCELIDGSTSDLAVQASAVSAVQRFRGGPLAAIGATDLFGDARSCAVSVWWFVKHLVKFVHHEDQIRKWLNEADELQLLISPDVVLHMKRPEGDCAIFTMLICALLKCLGVPFEIVTIGVTHTDDPSLFSHVWPRAVLADGSRIDLDASHGKYPGWCVPPAEWSRVQVWDESGSPIADQGRRFQGLHGYRRGLGQDPNDYITAGQDTGSSFTFLPGTATSPSVPGVGPLTVTSPAGPSFWSQELANLANAWTQIGGRVVAPTTTISQTGPGGQSYSLTTPGGSAGSSLVAPGLFASTSSSSWIWLGLAVVLGVVGVSSMGKR